MGGKTGRLISTLIKSNGNAAPKMTNALKTIGNGDMQRGISTIYNAGRTDTLVAVAVAVSVGTVVFIGAKNWLHSKRNKKFEEMILQQKTEIDQSTNTGSECNYE